MEEKTAVEERSMDRRLVDRNLQKGIISQADIDMYESSLKDVSDNLEVVTIDAEHKDAEATSDGVQAAVSPTENATASASGTINSFSSTQGGA